MQPTLFDNPQPIQVVTNEPKRESYAKLVPSLPDRRRAVYYVVAELGPCAALEVAQKLNLPINSITGRLDELIKAGLIVKAGRKLNPLGNTATAYRIAEQTLANS